MRSLSFLLLLFPLLSSAQFPVVEEEFLNRLNTNGPLPENLLSTRTAVFYDYRLTDESLERIQQHFQQSGVDAVAYFQSDLLTAGRDISVAVAIYLNSREISNIALIQRHEEQFRLFIFGYNRLATFADEHQPAWLAQDPSLEEVMLDLYRTSAQGLVRENFLIIDVPETGLRINPIRGRRSEFFAIDLSIDPLAVPKFGDEEKDRRLAEIMKIYPYKYALTEPHLTEAELRKMGYFYVLRFVHARARVAKDILGYDLAPSQSAIVSITYPGEQPEVKNIGADTEVYKFYFKHIDSGNTFLGTKWDADISWEQALINQLKGFRLELKIN